MEIIINDGCGDGGGDDDTDVWGGAGNDDSNGGYDSVYTVVGGDEFVYNYSS